MFNPRFRSTPLIGKYNENFTRVMRIYYEELKTYGFLEAVQC